MSEPQTSPHATSLLALFLLCSDPTLRVAAVFAALPPLPTAPGSSPLELSVLTMAGPQKRCGVLLWVTPGLLGWAHGGSTSLAPGAGSTPPFPSGLVSVSGQTVLVLAPQTPPCPLPAWASGLEPRLLVSADSHSSPPGSAVGWSSSPAPLASVLNISLDSWVFIVISEFSIYSE